MGGNLQREKWEEKIEGGQTCEFGQWLHRVDKE